MVTVTVPATSANVGAGFDSLGLAVSMHNVFTFEESDRIQITSVDGTHVPAGSNNLVYRSARVVYDQLGIPLKGLRITQRNDIPMARGLGSSSACIVAGIMGANALLGDKLTERQMLTLATAIEGHPDNVAPAMLGGFVTSVIDEGQVYSVKKDIDPELAFAAFVPDFRLLTSKARAALPAMVSHKDACLARRWQQQPSARATTRCWAWQQRMCCTRNTACRSSRAAMRCLSWHRIWVRRLCTSRAQGRPSWPLCIRMIQSSLPVPRRRLRRTARCIILPCIVCWPTMSAQW
jgi:hypothetical protein